MKRDDGQLVISVIPTGPGTVLLDTDGIDNGGGARAVPAASVAAEIATDVAAFLAEQS